MTNAPANCVARGSATPFVVSALLFAVPPGLFVLLFLAIFAFPVWPSTRRPWPPRSSRGFSVGKRCRLGCAGGRCPHLHQPVRDLDLPFARHDGRRLEVVADGLPLFNGAQFAITTGLFSSCRWSPRRQCAHVDGAALAVVLSSALIQSSRAITAAPVGCSRN